MLATLTSLSLADVPTNCYFSDLIGTWQFHVGLTGSRDDVTTGADYQNLGPVSSILEFTFEEYDLVKNLKFGSVGTFTTIYAQAIEFEIDGRIFWAHWYFDENGDDCSKTSVGFSHDKTGNSWARIQGFKVDGEKVSRTLPKVHDGSSQMYRKDADFVEKINSFQPFFKAKHYEKFESMNLKDFQKMHGTSALQHENKIVNIFERVEAAKRMNEKIFSKNELPENLDWRNHNGMNFVGSVDDQASCGSCYSFASMGVLEARARVMTNNLWQPKFSEQDVMTCGQDRTYNQGCSGGWSFLTAGQYAVDFGVVDESCMPYDTTNYDRVGCQDASHCKRYYSQGGEYLGGFYGAVTDDGGEAMVKELQNGPVAVGIKTDSDFSHYESGVYVQTSLKSDFNPYEPVGHAVLCVGYGVCPEPGPDSICDDAEQGIPYWIVKNSWGSGWGKDGYILMLRGVDNAAINSMPFVANPVVPINYN